MPTEEAVIMLLVVIVIRRNVFHKYSTYGIMYLISYLADREAESVV